MAATTDSPFKFPCLISSILDNLGNYILVYNTFHFQIVCFPKSIRAWQVWSLTPDNYRYAPSYWPIILHGFTGKQMYYLNWGYIQREETSESVLTDNIVLSVLIFCWGSATFGPWWEHYLYYWKRRHEPNVFYVKFEDMKRVCIGPKQTNYKKKNNNNKNKKKKQNKTQTKGPFLW